MIIEFNVAVGIFHPFAMNKIYGTTNVMVTILYSLFIYRSAENER